MPAGVGPDVTGRIVDARYRMRGGPADGKLVYFDQFAGLLRRWPPASRITAGCDYFWTGERDAKGREIWAPADDPAVIARHDRMERDARLRHAPDHDERPRLSRKGAAEAGPSPRALESEMRGDQ